MFLEIHINKFEDKVELVLGVDHLKEPHDIWMVQLFQQGNLSNRGRRHPFILGLPQGRTTKCRHVSARKKGVGVSCDADHRRADAAFRVCMARCIARGKRSMPWVVGREGGRKDQGEGDREREVWRMRMQRRTRRKRRSRTGPDRMTSEPRK